MTEVEVLNPIGIRPIPDPRPLAGRTGGIDGRTVYLIDGQFDNGPVLLQKVADWLARHRPEIVTKQARWGMPYEQDPNLATEIRDNNGLVIYGVGLGGATSQDVVAQTLWLERAFGIVTVGIHTHAFSEQVRYLLDESGAPNAAVAFVPHPVMDIRPDGLEAYVNGNDPITGRPFMTEVLEGLTRPREHVPAKYDATTSRPARILAKGDEDRLHELFLEMELTDGLPIVLPTERRVEAMLKGTSHAPDKIVGHMSSGRGSKWSYTVEQVAVNAVMAGARPEYLPVILALASSGRTARILLTTSMANMAIVNGPIRKELGMNCGNGAMGPYSHANGTIGRAYGLLSQNFQGGSKPGVTYFGTQGNAFAYSSLIIPENEEDSPWGPFHVQHGMDPEESAVSVYYGCRSTAYTPDVREFSWQVYAKNLLQGMDPFEPPVFLLSPLAAERFIKYAGFDTKEKLADWAYENAMMPAHAYWDHQRAQTLALSRAYAGDEDYAVKHRAAPDEMINMFIRSEIEVVVVGGDTGATWRIMGGNACGKPISIDAWR